MGTDPTSHWAPLPLPGVPAQKLCRQEVRHAGTRKTARAHVVSTGARAGLDAVPVPQS